MDPAVASAASAADPAARVARPPWWGRVAGLGTAAAATAYVAIVDPSSGGVYPLCPSQVLLGVDCPACGALRGTHALLHGDVARALDHNLLLPLWLGVVAALAGAWLLPLTARQAPAVRLPRWLAVAAVAAVVGFTVLRNLPIAGLEYLASDA